MKQHYNINHNINVQEYLMKQQKVNMEIKNSPDQTNYVTCRVCFTNMKNEEHLKYHVEMLHNYKLHGGTKRRNIEGTDCTLCNAKFKKAIYLRKHVRRSHKEFLFDGNQEVICHHCSKRFQTKGDFRSHFWHIHLFRDGAKPLRRVKPVKHKTNTYESTICEMCGEILCLKKQLNNHKCDIKKNDHRKKVTVKKTKQDCLNHQQITDFSSAFCKFCNKHFVSPYNFKLHVRTYDEEVFYCTFSECGKRFTSRLWFQRHLKLHVDKNKSP